MREDAIDFMKEAHRDQHRINGTEFSNHPLAVGLLLVGEEAEEDTIVAGFLHDVIEDTKYSYEDIKTKFNERVADIVMEVTKPKGIRKEDRLNYFVKMIPTYSLQALQVKLADRYHNLTDSLGLEHKTRQRWVNETKAMLEAIPSKMKKDTIVRQLIILLNHFIEDFENGR